MKRTHLWILLLAAICIVAVVLVFWSGRERPPQEGRVPPSEAHSESDRPPSPQAEPPQAPTARSSTKDGDAAVDGLVDELVGKTVKSDPLSDPQWITVYPQLPGLEMIEQPQNANNMYVRESPDGRYAAFFCGSLDRRWRDFVQRIQIRDNESGEETTIQTAHAGDRVWISDFAWFPDGSRILYTDRYKSDGEIPPEYAKLSPVDRPEIGIRFDLCVFDLETKTSRKVDTIEGAQTLALAVSDEMVYFVLVRTGHPAIDPLSLYRYVGEQLASTIEVSAGRGELIENAQILSNRGELWYQATFCGIDGLRDPPDGIRYRICSVDISATRPQPRVAIPHGFRFCWDAEGKQIVYRILDPPTGEVPNVNELYLARGDLKHPILLLREKNLPKVVGFSRDGKYLYFEMPKSGVSSPRRKDGVQNRTLFSFPLPE